MSDVCAHEHGVTVTDEGDVVDALVETAEFLVDLAADVGEVLGVVEFWHLDITKVLGEDAIRVDAILGVAEHLDPLPNLDIVLWEDEEHHGNVWGFCCCGGVTEDILD